MGPDIKRDGRNPAARAAEPRKVGRKGKPGPRAGDDGLPAAARAVPGTGSGLRDGERALPVNAHAVPGGVSEVLDGVSAVPGSDRTSSCR